MAAWRSGLLGDHVPRALALSPGLEAIRVSTLPGCRLAVAGRGGGTASAGDSPPQGGGGRRFPHS